MRGAAAESQTQQSNQQSFKFEHSGEQGQDNQPKECYSPDFTIQKLNYIHNNPVESGIVDKAEEYIYSSARDYYYQRNCGLLKVALI